MDYTFTVKDVPKKDYHIVEVIISEADEIMWKEIVPVKYETGQVLMDLEYIKQKLPDQETRQRMIARLKMFIAEMNK